MPKITFSLIKIVPFKLGILMYLRENNMNNIVFYMKKNCIFHTVAA